ncbi:hypothetical protein HA466_0166180 [Hirschfeldia incana]|nr:hypothetical protein HA466_0166180 [Hirschfeldia incana]
MSKSTDSLHREERAARTKERSDELEDEIIAIPDCDMEVMAERFRLTLIGRVLHHGSRSVEALIMQLPRPRIWNVEGTFNETAKALGTKLAIYDKSARIHVSVNIDKPLQFERRIGFKNGDTAKISLSYTGLHRYCYTCRMISHDENTCPELTAEQREQKRLQRLEANVTGSHREGSFDRRLVGKRQRSPSLELARASPPRKFQANADKGRIGRSDQHLNPLTNPCHCLDYLFRNSLMRDSNTHALVIVLRGGIRERVDNTKQERGQEIRQT